MQRSYCETNPNTPSIFTKYTKKTNRNNTLMKFYNPEVEYVTKLNFYKPHENKTSLFDLKKKSLNEKHTEQINNSMIRMRNRLPKIGKELDSSTNTVDVKYLSMQRIENINYETNLENKRKQLEMKLKQMRSDEKKLFHQLTLYKNDVKEYEIDIEFLDNYYKLSGFENKYNNLAKRKSNDNESYEMMMKMKKHLDLEENRRNNELETKKIGIEKKNGNVEKLRQVINLLQKQIKKVSLERDEVRDSLSIHYHKLLSEGKDGRKEGLTWLCKAIWNLGQKIIPSYLPQFLDELSLSYLFSYSQNEIELSKIKKKLDDVHLSMKIKQEKINIAEKKSQKNVLPGDTHRTFKTGLGYSNTENLTEECEDLEINKRIIKSLIERHKKENELFYNEENYNFKKIQELMKDRERIGEEALNYIKTVKLLESEYKNMLSSMVLMKRNEMNRINKEFYANDYERRYKISQEEVVGALIGEDLTLNEIVRQKREKNKYFQELENIRSFNFLQDIISVSVKK